MSSSSARFRSNGASWITSRINPYAPWTAVLALVATALSCSRLPDYAAPQGELVDPNELDNSQLIAYRTLSRDDFLAKELPAHANRYARKIGAMTCARISTTPNTGFVAREVQSADEGTLLEARFRDLGFIALMDRKCSWWNPSEALPHAYVLQHEQIHFAITELGARKLDARAPAIVRDFQATATSQEDAQAQVRSKLESLIEQAMQELLERHLAFDEATSGVHAPAVQQRWFDEVSLELATTSN